MERRQYRRRSVLPSSVEEVEGWHRRAGAMERLVPPWTPVEVLVEAAPPVPGSRAVTQLRAGRWKIPWVAEIRHLEGRAFRDVQVRGPLAAWSHDHLFRPGEGAGAILEDRVEYALPLGPLGAAVAGRFHAYLDRVFAYRHRTVAADLAAHARYPAPGDGGLRIAVTGSRGLVGGALVPYLRAGGYRVLRLVRREPKARDEVRWDPGGGVPEPGRLEGVDAVVHLAGAPVAGVWTEVRKARIRESRVRGTRELAESLAALDRPPRAFVAASGMNYYGDRGDEPLVESAGPGSGFLASVCRDWEAAAGPLASAGTRVVHLRFGLVLSPAGGALAAMLPAFRLGLGGPLGHGRQFVSWITVDDVLDVILHALVDTSLDGPVNAGSPRPVRNTELTRTLGRVLGRPTALGAPERLLRLGGQMVEEMLLASVRMRPAVLEEAGHTFRHPELEEGLRHVLGRTVEGPGRESGGEPQPP